MGIETRIKELETEIGDQIQGVLVLPNGEEKEVTTRQALSLFCEVIDGHRNNGPIEHPLYSDLLQAVGSKEEGSLLEMIRNLDESFKHYNRKGDQ